jgi:hypothetical protein
MKRLEKLGFIARQAELAFDKACQIYYCDGRWGYYRAVECDYKIPEGLHRKCDEYLGACHAYYLERDEKYGVLGFRAA